MADFRKCIPALAVLVLMLGLVSTASAQIAPGAFACTASAAVPPILRAEGMTELAGDIVLNCTGGTPTLATTSTGAANMIPQANITVFLNTTVTSRLLANGGSEALLMIDEPGSLLNPSGQLPCGSLSGCTVQGTSTVAGIAGPEPFCGPTTTCTNPAAVGPRPNMFQGTVSGNSVTFLGVPVDPPGTSGSRVFRITNVRANATAVAPGGSGFPGQVIALISISGPTSVPIFSPQQVVGVVQTGLNFSIGSAFAAAQCVSKSKVLINTLKYQEGFATSFKTRTAAAFSSTEASPAPVDQNRPGAIYNTESGFEAAAFASTSIAGAGLADFGTRLKATFNNIPAGISLWVSIINAESDASLGTGATTVARLVGTEGGAFFAVPNSDTFGSDKVAQVSLVNNSGMAVWEVLASNPLAVQTYSFGVYVSYTANPGSNSPAIGTGTVNGSFAPTPPSFSASAGVQAQGASYPIPRFADTSTAKNLITIFICHTNLLFPFVTNQGGFDTGLAIANTSTDPFGTAPQSGTCSLNFYGANAPAAVTTAAVASGATYVNLASTLAPNFQGYMIAVCNFQYAHGFAFISDIGARNLAMGYLALVIPDPPRNPNPFPAAGAGSGEQLGQ